MNDNTTALIDTGNTKFLSLFDLKKGPNINNISPAMIRINSGIIFIVLLYKLSI